MRGYGYEWYSRRRELEAEYRRDRLPGQDTDPPTQRDETDEVTDPYRQER